MICDDDDFKACTTSMAVAMACSLEHSKATKQVQDILSDVGSDDQDNEMLAKAEQLLKQWQDSLIKPTREESIQQKADEIIKTYKDYFDADFEKVKPFAVQMLRERILNLDVELWLAEAQRGMNIAEFLLGELFINGKDGIQQNPEQALYWLKSIAKRGYGPALFTLGLMTLNGDLDLIADRDKGLAFIRAASSARCVSEKALFFLYELYKNGDGVEQNIDIAHYYLQAAACFGSKQAIDLVTADPKVINLLFLQTLAQKSPAYAFLLGYLYLNPGNCGLMPDTILGIEYLTQASRPDVGGSYNACIVLGDFYRGLKKFFTAESWYMRAIELGQSQAIEMVDKLLKARLGFTYTVARKEFQDLVKVIALVDSINDHVPIEKSRDLDELLSQRSPELWQKVQKLRMEQFLYDFIIDGKSPPVQDVSAPALDY